MSWIDDLRDRELSVEVERESFDRAMATIDRMSEEDRRALLAYSVAASIRYAVERESEILIQNCAALLRTLRVNAHPEYVRAMARLAEKRAEKPQ